MNQYEDIMHLPRPEPKRHPRATRISRAAQFGAFRALAGHEDAVAETARVTENRQIVGQHVIDMVNYRLQVIKDRLSEGHTVSITYFKPDDKKEGGAYVTLEGQVAKIDEYKKKLIMLDKREIDITMIIALEGNIFSAPDII
ncbi:MAG: hypothetical protein E7393_07105 [Ruminococcaceae bacterium]|nr:hypothetical protein [Oscillospiraceae bacterium]